MARIKVLELPSRQVGEYYETPFALIIDQTAEGDTAPIVSYSGDVVAEVPSAIAHAALWLLPETSAPLEAFAERVGAAGVLVVPGTLDLA